MNNNHIAVDLGSAYGLPAKQTLCVLPGGMYYPSRDASTNMFVLKKVVRQLGSRQIGNHFIDTPDDDFGVDYITRLSIDGWANQKYSESERRLFYSATRTQRELYFNMENYHPGLSLAKESVVKFIANRKFYSDRELNFKRSVLMFGDPGTGKSRLLYELCMNLIQLENAVVIKVDTDTDLDTFYDYGIIPMSQQLGGRMKVILIEELSQLCTGYRDLVKLLHLLDSMVLNDNILFLMSTNYPERIPANVIDRPSRIDVISAVNPKDFSMDMIGAWYEHLMGDIFLPNSEDSEWMNAKLTPAYLKELFMYSKINDCSFVESWRIIKSRRQLIESNFAEENRTVGF